MDRARLDSLMAEADLDAVLVTSKHNIQYLLGGYRFFFFDTMDAVAVSRYLPALVYRKGKPVIKLHMEAYLGAPESYDAVRVTGSPALNMKIAGGVHGDIATASITVNSIPKVLQAAPGLRTMRDMVLPSFTG